MFKLSLSLTFTALLYIALPVHAAMPILKTGQTVSYDQDGNITSTLKDDGYYQAGADRHYSRTDDIVRS